MSAKISSSKDAEIIQKHEAPKPALEDSEELTQTSNRETLPSFPSILNRSTPTGIQALHSKIGNQAITSLVRTRSASMSLNSPKPIQRQIAKTAVKSQPKTALSEKDGSDWMDAGNHDTLPGVGALDYPGPYTEADRVKMFDALKKRERENRANVAQFLKDYVTATVEISTKYVSEEMSDTAKSMGTGLLGRLVKYALGETVEALAAGGVGVFAWKLSGRALHVFKFLGEKGAGFGLTEILDKHEDELLNEELDKREAALNLITSKFAENTGKIVEEVILAMNGDILDRTYWLRGAKVADLNRFRIPEAFPPSKRERIRAVVAGILASHAHTGKIRTERKPWLGLQPSGGDTFDRHEAIVNLQATKQSAIVRSVQINSSSRVLARELTGSLIGMHPRLPLFIIVEGLGFMDATEELLNACRSPVQASLSDTLDFFHAYQEKVYEAQPPNWEKDWGTLRPDLEKSAVYGKMIIKRTPDGDITINSARIDGDIWLYRWATGDHNLTQLATQLIAWQNEIEKHEESRGESIVSAGISPTRLGKLARQRMASSWNLAGARKFISDLVGNLVLQSPTGERAKGIAIDPRDRWGERP